MASATPKLYVVTYEYSPNSAEKRASLREAHSANIKEQVTSGNIVLAGPVGQPPTGALLIVRNLSENDIDKIVKEDPYYTNGLLSKSSIQPYFAVVGDNALKNDFVKL